MLKPIIGFNLNLTAKRFKELEHQYGRYYGDSLIIPMVELITKKTVKKYSAGEIYNYKREEIESKLKNQIGIALESMEMNLGEFFLFSIEIPDSLMKRLEEEHIQKLNREENENP